MLILAATGCPPTEETLDRAAREEVLTRLNRSSAAVDVLLKASGDAVAEFPEAGERRRYHVTATLLHRRPRNLYLRLEHTLSPDARIEIGSNEDAFWLWDRAKSGRPRYLTGRYDRLGAHADLDLYLRPDHLPEVLGLIEAPLDVRDPRGPLFRVLPEYYELLYLDRTPDGSWYVVKSVWVDRRNSEHVPSRVLIYSADGYSLMEADLSRYRPVRNMPSPVSLPHRIDINWPRRNASLLLSFHTIEPFDTPEAERRAEERFILQSPFDRLGGEVGEIEWLDDVPSHLEEPAIGSPSQPLDHEDR